MKVSFDFRLLCPHYLHNNFPLPIHEYKKLFPKEFPIYASIEVERDEKNYRKVAKTTMAGECRWYKFYLTFFTSRERGIEPPFHVIHEIADSRILEDLNSSNYYRRRFAIP